MVTINSKVDPLPPSGPAQGDSSLHSGDTAGRIDGRHAPCAPSRSGRGTLPSLLGRNGRPMAFRAAILAPLFSEIVGGQPAIHQETLIAGGKGGKPRLLLAADATTSATETHSVLTADDGA